MTNYNERLGEILTKLDRGEYLGEGGVNTARTAITSLIKDLVAEAKPEPENMGDASKAGWARGHNVAADQFEQNLFKALEEV